MKYLVSILATLLLLVGCSKKTSSETSQNKDITKDMGWPRQVENENATLVYYQPQIDKWEDYKKLEGRFAFSLTPKGSKEILGVASFTCDTKTDKGARVTYLHDIDYTDIRFPALDEKTSDSIKKVFLNLMPVGSETISMDRILAYLDSNTNQGGNPPVALKNDPPRIFYSSTPAVLLIVDGDPVLSPIEKTNLQFVVNTNWDLFQDKPTKQYYLLAGNTWMTSEDLEGGWKQANSLPKDMSVLPSGQNFDEVIKNIPPHSVTQVPKVFYSNVPAELLLTDGSPVFSKIQGTQLSYISNTDNDIFLDQADNNYYVLLSGRWFSSSNLEGPWVYAGNSLPSDFAKIPEDSPKSRVLASVPGTVQASDAVLLAQVPTTVVVNKKEAEAKAKVTYDGTPKFAPIQGTSMQYATNTQDKVIKVGDLYYMCFQAVWFVSASPNGPWKTADSVPKEIYTIPPSSPVYNVTYVTQTNPTDTTVESSSTGGYLGAFVIGVTVGAIINSAIVYGTGWYYPPYMYYPPGAFYPVYRPWPYTYGGGAVYNPWTGGWATGRVAYGPYGSAGASAWYNPATGRYGRSASVQGWYGGRSAADTYNPWTGTYGHTSQAHDPYAQWGHSVVTNNSQWARTGHVTTAAGTAFGYQTSGGKEGVITHGANGTVIHTNNGVYAGRDGNVYRKNSDGTWSKYNNNQKQWQQAKLGGETQHKPETKNLSGVTQNQRKNLGGETQHQPVTRHEPITQRKTAENSRPIAEHQTITQHKPVPQNNEPVMERQPEIRQSAASRGQSLNSISSRRSSSDNIEHNLNLSEQSRLRGQVQTQHFQGFQQGGGHLQLRGRR